MDNINKSISYVNKLIVKKNNNLNFIWRCIEIKNKYDTSAVTMLNNNFYISSYKVQVIIFYTIDTYM